MTQKIITFEDSHRKKIKLYMSSAHDHYWVDIGPTVHGAASLENIMHLNREQVQILINGLQDLMRAYDD